MDTEGRGGGEEQARETIIRIYCMRRGTRRKIAYFPALFPGVEHTLSFNDCEEGLTVVCQKNGGAIICYPHSSGGCDQYAEEIMKDRNASYLFEGISADVVRYLVEREGMELTEAISTFHNSETFSKLEDFSTGLYIESPAYVYDLLLSELRNGRLVP